MFESQFMSEAERDGLKYKVPEIVSTIADSYITKLPDYSDRNQELELMAASFARGEETSDSDVDILVRFDRSTSSIGLFAYMRMHRELEERLGRKVDLAEEGTLRPAAQLTANRDKKLIYERSN